MDELWRAVVGQEGRYEVSDRGRVRSLRIRKGGVDRPRIEPLIISGSVSHGYVRVRLADRARRFVHTLVLEAFVGPCPEGMEAAHENGVQTDNRLANLTWKTHVDNERDKVGHGTLLVGERHWSRRRPERRARGEGNAAAKLTAAQVVEIRAAGASGEQQRALAARFGVSQKAVALVIDRKTWTHVADGPMPERPADQEPIATPIRRGRVRAESVS